MLALSLVGETMIRSLQHSSVSPEDAGRLGKLVLAAIVALTLFRRVLEVLRVCHFYFFAESS